MYITQETLTIMKNFADMNPSIAVNAGNRLVTIARNHSILGYCTVKEEFPLPFAVYDLGEFLKVIRLFDRPVYEFTEKFITIREEIGYQTARYHCVDASQVDGPKPGTVENGVNMEVRYKPEIAFSLSEEAFEAIMRAVRTLQLPEIAVLSDGQEISLVAIDTRNAGSNTHSVAVGRGNGTPFTMVFRVENLNVLKGPYSVKISSKGVARFSHRALDLNYFIALERERSTYGSQIDSEKAREEKDSAEKRRQLQTLREQVTVLEAEVGGPKSGV